MQGSSSAQSPGHAAGSWPRSPSRTARASRGARAGPVEQDALTRAVIQIGSVLRPGTEDQRLTAVLAAQRSVEELRESFRNAMLVVTAARGVRDAYRASLAAPDPLAAARALDDVERAEAALLIAVERLPEAAPPADPSQAWIDGAL